MKVPPVKMRLLTAEEYAKTAWRKKQAALSPSEKVRQVVAMQERARPILAACGVRIVPWTRDEGEGRGGRPTMTYPSCFLRRGLATCLHSGQNGWTIPEKQNSRLQKYELSKQEHFSQKAS